MHPVKKPLTCVLANWGYYTLRTHPVLGKRTDLRIIDES